MEGEIIHSSIYFSANVGTHVTHCT